MTCANSLVHSCMEESLSMPLAEVLKIIQTRIVTNSTYFGIPCQRSPLDFWIYQEIMVELRPDVIVEIGNYCGGSALALAHLCDSLRKGRALGVDVDHSRIHQIAKDHPRIEFVTGEACAVFDRVAAACDKSRSVLVIEDSSHEYASTLNILRKYAALVTPSSYLIVEDGICHHGLDVGPKPGPYEAIEDFVREMPQFVIDRSRESFLITWNPKGYLKKLG